MLIEHISKKSYRISTQDFQIISLTSPLLDILDLHPITTHLSNLPIFHDAATKWPHCSTSPQFTLHKISHEYARPGATYFLVWMFVAQILPQRLFTSPWFCRGWWKVRCAKVCSLISFQDTTSPLSLLSNTFLPLYLPLELGRCSPSEAKYNSHLRVFNLLSK